MARTPIQFGENMRITVAASQGGRRYMEDRCVIHTERINNGLLDWTFVGVFDGHGGEHASEYVRRHLLMNITKNQKFESNSDEDILEAIRQGFLMTHEQMRHVYDEWPYTASGYPSTAGTTVSCVFIRNGKLYTGHVGDSAIFLGTVENGELHSRPLTTDHKPESVHEQLRIAKAGGETAVKSGVTRVVWKRPQKMSQFMMMTSNSNEQKHHQNPQIMENIPFLSVARSLGDLWSYNEKTNMFIVSPEPDLGVHRLTGNDFCLVLASDGMTNVMTGDQAISIVFKEEEMVEIHEEINRNHSRCVLRSALQKWRSLRADNVTIATVIFDIEPIKYTDAEMLMKVGKYVNASQVLTDRPDAMLKVSKNENILLSTQRTPIIYNGSKDVNFCRVTYKGPGFRTHEDELLEERRNLMSKFGGVDGGAAIAIAGGPPVDARRGDTTGKDENNVKYDVNGEEDDIINDITTEEEASQEIDLSLRLVQRSTAVTIIESPNRPPRPHAPRPVFIDDSIIEEENDGNLDEKSLIGVQITPSRTSPGHCTVRRVKAEAVRKLRTPKMSTMDESSSSSTPPDRRITRSASKGLKTPPTPEPPRGIIGVNPNLTADAVLLLTPRRRRSTRIQNSCASAAAPGAASLSTEKLTQSSRKRARTCAVGAASGVTPVVASLTLQDHQLLRPHTHAPPPTPSRSAPSSPSSKKCEISSSLKTSKSAKASSLSKLDDGIIRVSEIADEEDDDDVTMMRGPPSKMRRFFGYMKKMVWGK